MFGKLSLKAVVLFISLFSLVSMAQHHDASGKNSDTAVVKETSKDEQRKIDLKAFIAHHLQDSHDFHLFSYTNDEKKEISIGFPLPVILWDGGLKVFLSSAFHHGETIVQNGDSHYKLYHGKIYKTDSEGSFVNDEDGNHVKPLDFSFTKNIAVIFIVGLLMLLIFGRMAKSYKKDVMPKGIGRALEPLVVYVRDEIAIPNIGKKHHGRFMSFLLTVFFFVWIINLLGLTPLGVNVTNNLAVTAALALITYVLTTFSANKGYWKHIFWMPGVPKPMRIILAPIELLGTIIKPFSLMIRLYANITAGHIVLMSILGMILLFQNWIGSSLSFVLAFVLSLLELLVAALQAYIFTMLSALYFGSAVAEDDH